MSEKEVLAWLFQLAIGVLVSFGAYWIKQVKNSSETTQNTVIEIREHLAALNGSVKACDQLRIAHEKSDEDKHESCERRILTIEKALIQSREG